MSKVTCNSNQKSDYLLFCRELVGLKKRILWVQLKLLLWPSVVGGQVQCKKQFIWATDGQIRLHELIDIWKLKKFIFIKQIIVSVCKKLY